MREISLHLLDLIQNAAQAGAGHVTVSVHADLKQRCLGIEVMDDGCGIPKTISESAGDPFFHGTSGRLHFGLPLFEASCERTGGFMRVQEKAGTGTVVRGEYQLDHPDLPPLGDVEKIMRIESVVWRKMSFCLAVHLTDAAGRERRTRFCSETFSEGNSTSKRIQDLLAEIHNATAAQFGCGT